MGPAGGGMIPSRREAPAGAAAATSPGRALAGPAPDR